MDDTMDIRHGKKWFLSLDLEAKSWQMELLESAELYTAFTVGPLSLCEFK